jgi:hypothetical protein
VIRKIFVAVLFSLLLVVPAFANDSHITDPTDGNVINTNTSTNVQSQSQGIESSISNRNSNKQSQGQGQGQYQGQGQGQGQNNNQTIAPYQGQDVRIETPHQAPTVIAPGLTAAGTGVCLGSVSIGLSGPMAGASFGITKVDQGCELRSNAALLYQMGYKDAAVRLLMKNDDVKNALGAEAPVAAKTAITVPQEQVQPISLSIPAAMERTQRARVESVQTN